MIRLWDPVTGKELRTIDRPGREVFALAWSPDGKLLAWGNHQGVVGVWDNVAGKELSRMELVQARHPLIYSLAFRPDGRSLAAAGAGGVVRYWDPITGAEQGQLQKDEPRPGRTRIEDIHGVAFAPDGWTLATACSDSTVRLWEAVSGEERARFEGHASGVSTVLFLPDGRRLVSGSKDSTVLIWDATGRSERPRIPANPTAAQLEQLWADLGSEGHTAYRAVLDLIGAPASAVRLLKERVRPASVDPVRLDRLLRDLDHDEFEVRDRASRELEILGKSIQLFLTEAQRSSSPEVRRRIELLLTAMKLPTVSGELLRAVRSIEVLERIGTEEARAVLRSLAGGSPELRLTQEAKAALERLARHPQP
jgi:hypothetical protein